MSDDVQLSTSCYDTAPFPTFEEAIAQTKPDFDDFSSLKGQLGASDQLHEFTREITCKVKLNNVRNGKDYATMTIPVYPKFLALFNKERACDITLFDVNQMFNKEQFEQEMADDNEACELQYAAVEIMGNMKEENRFDFNAELNQADLDVIKKYLPDFECKPGMKYSDIMQVDLDVCNPDFISEVESDTDNIVLPEFIINSNPEELGSGGI